MKLFNGVRMGEWFTNRSLEWLASTVTVAEYQRIKALQPGETWTRSLKDAENELTVRRVA